MYKKCSKCGKLFNTEDKFVKMVDSDGNELNIGLCDRCEYEHMINEIVEAKHISQEEANRYMFNKITEIVYNVKPYNNGDTLKYYNYWNQPITVNRFNAVIRMVKDNE